MLSPFQHLLNANKIKANTTATYPETRKIREMLTSLQIQIRAIHNFPIHANTLCCDVIFLLHLQLLDLNERLFSFNSLTNERLCAVIAPYRNVNYSLSHTKQNRILMRITHRHNFLQQHFSLDCILYGKNNTNGNGM